MHPGDINTSIRRPDSSAIPMLPRRFFRKHHVKMPTRFAQGGVLGGGPGGGTKSWRKPNLAQGIPAEWSTLPSNLDSAHPDALDQLAAADDSARSAGLVPAVASHAPSRTAVPAGQPATVYGDVCFHPPARRTFAAFLAYAGDRTL